MTIHSEHPFATPPADRDQVRQFRGRIAAGVTIWTASSDGRPAGLTVSSMLVAAGSPGRVLGLIDPDSDLYLAMRESGLVAVSVLGSAHRYLADAFAGLVPAPGGVFRLATWHPTAFGPVLSDAVAWAGARLVEEEPKPAGWGNLVEAVIDSVDNGGASAGLVHHRGRYTAL